MRHSQLKAFHHVALLGGFSRAAEALHLTQPAISEQVRKLEQQHDVLLFSRDRKRVQLTEAGHQLFLRTKQYFEIELQIHDYLTETSAAVHGTLRIVADSAHHVTDILRLYRQRYPNVTLSLRVGNTEEILEELRAYNAEIGVAGSPSPGKDMDMLDLGATEIIGFASKDLLPAGKTSVTLKELATMPLIFREVGSKTREKLVQEAAKQGITLLPAIEAEGREAGREVVASGAGIGFVSRAEFGSDARLVPLKIDGLNINMSESLVHLSQRRDVKVIRSFMDCARSLQG
ncbi:LysR substrate-binding domain-containing protein [Parasedimentitalea psychrophila]|uniref:LysR substrate-binding domain-containing protein n=1 Tax=Parasedimentitalea psychrophila TaxID=2997337 RepID=A0A9Y2L2G0_9RHOB|nr:LysR substrate-binding domain-containing protein [Parasedimentitalea psychrophila]WIY25639.1 LysR substrate-binding domain-containing protein [Parasedimentitalea psychrophila]